MTPVLEACAIASLTATHYIPIHELTPRSASLEDVYLEDAQLRDLAREVGVLGLLREVGASGWSPPSTRSRSASVGANSETATHPRSGGNPAQPSDIASSPPSTMAFNQPASHNDDPTDTCRSGPSRQPDERYTEQASLGSLRFCVSMIL